MRTLPRLLLLASLAAPASAAPAPEPSEAAVLAVLPFERPEEANRIYVNLAPEGHRPFQWMLDTGAVYSVMTPRTARAAGVTVRKVKDSPYRRPTLLGRDVQFWVDSSWSDSGTATGMEYGLLGGNFLEKYVVELDFEARRVRLLDPDAYVVPETVDAPDEAVIPMKTPGKRPFVDVELNGEQVHVLFDTGDPPTLTVSGSAAKQMGIDVKSLPPFGEWRTTRGRMEVRLFEAETLRIAGFDFETTPVLVAPHGAYNLGGSKDSTLGYDVISQFTVRLDYPRRRMWLKRNRTAITYLGVPYGPTREAGLFVFPGPSGVVVLGVIAGSPAARLGFQPGDTVMPWNLEGGVAGMLERVANEEPIVVSRRVGDIDDEVTLQIERSPADAAAERSRQAEQTAARDAPSREAWKERQNERLFVKERGRWVVIEGYRRRQGPKEGEEWVTFEEMQRRKAAAESPAGPQ